MKRAGRAHVLVGLWLPRGVEQLSSGPGGRGGAVADGKQLKNPDTKLLKPYPISSWLSSSGTPCFFAVSLAIEILIAKDKTAITKASAIKDEALTSRGAAGVSKPLGILPTTFTPHKSLNLAKCDIKVPRITTIKSIGMGIFI